jgi:hypothetical protein
MSTDRKSIGCVAIIIGALIIGGAIMNDSSPRNKAPVLSQPETGIVRREAAAPRQDYATPTPRPVRQEPVYVPPAPPPLTRAQILDGNPVQPEPIPGLQGQSGVIGGDSALKLINHLPSPAYVKVLNGFGATVATIYLRVQESHELELPADSYVVKYATGPASEWRGPVHYFGSSSTFHKGEPKAIGSNQILSLTFYQVVTRGYAAGGTPKISAEEFER